MLIQYPKIFKKRFVDRGLFLNIYGQVCTRCFGYGLSSTSMVPMADNLNHSSVDVTIEVIDHKLHLEADKNLSYYKICKYLNNYSALYDKYPV